MRNNKKIGIIAGNGVNAGIRLLDKIYNIGISNGNKRDCDHIDIIFNQACSSPSRSMYLEGKGESFVPSYRKIIKEFSDQNCKAFCICCNTAHAKKNELIKNISDKMLFIDIVEHTLLKSYQLGYKKLGILCSDGTIKANLFEKYIQKELKHLPKIEIIYPDSTNQTLVTKGIIRTKTLNSSKISTDYEIQLNYKKAINHLVKKNVDAIIIGCTDIILGDDIVKDDIHFLDSLDILANTIVDFSLGKSISSKKNTNLSADKVKNFFDSIADPENIYSTTFQEKSIAEQNTHLEFDNIIKPLCLTQNTKNVLDLGCGAGTFTKFFLDKCYLGVDFSEKLINLANAYFSDYKNVSFINGSFKDTHTYTKSKNNFDLIMCNGVMHYLDNKLLKELQESILNNITQTGVIYLRTSISNTESLELNDFFSKKLNKEYNAIYRSKYEYEDFFQKTLCKKGFNIVNSGFVGDKKIESKKETAKYYWVFKR